MAPVPADEMDGECFWYSACSVKCLQLIRTYLTDREIVSDADMVEDQEMELKLINEGDYPHELILEAAC